MTTTERRLFPTAAECGEPPVPPHDDLSRVRVVQRDSPEGKAILAQREARRAVWERLNGMTPRDVTLAGKLVEA